MKKYKAEEEDEPNGMNVFARLQRWHHDIIGMFESVDTY